MSIETPTGLRPQIQRNELYDCPFCLCCTALLVISAMGAARAFPPAAMGPSVIALSGTGLLSSLGVGFWSKRKREIIVVGAIAAFFMTMGALGAARVLSAHQVAWSVLGSGVTLFGIACTRSAWKQCKN